MKRRTFFSTLGAAAAPGLLSAGAGESAIDFRYAPLEWQTAFCFPDDRHKSLVGHTGELLYGHTRGRAADYFPLVVGFSLRGMEADVLTRQQLEAPGIPIVHTRIERPEAFLELVTFASNRPAEGRVDNVLITVRPRRRRALAGGLLTVRTPLEVTLERAGSNSLVLLNAPAGKRLLAVVDRPVTGRRESTAGWQLGLAEGMASAEAPLECLVRFPQEGQPPEQLAAASGAELLDQARQYWRSLRPFGGDVSWQFPGVYGEFLTACARNILQAREVRDGKLTFQVGPTVYRGLWIVDGNFILEAARYLGYDPEAQQGLETTWSYQQPSGELKAGAGEKHWKDTAIAMFTLVRQAELAQDWSYFNARRANVLRGVEFLSKIRDLAKEEGSPAGRYGILARGFGDGGLRLCEDVTNTVWSLAGLKAVTEAAGRGRFEGFDAAGRLYAELRAGFNRAAAAEMRRHPDGFDYLPMAMKDDALWNTPNEWERHKPQVGQWALSHAIYPGVVFTRDDPVVKGHIALMQAATREDVPGETGWITNGGLWTYNAAFVAHVYLWAGLADWARLTFNGFLNHATPLYCWREEQPFRGSLSAGYVGDMPHNWASAECVLYLRHMLALEDGPNLRLLAGIGAPELAAREPFEIKNTPTRFGRVSLRLEPESANAWRLTFDRSRGPAPAALEVPASLAARFRFAGATGAAVNPDGPRLLIAPQAASWSILWRA